MNKETHEISAETAQETGRVLADQLALACKNADWAQVVYNGGPPCFHLESGRFCLRAERWPGHGIIHPFYSLLDLLTKARGALPK